MVTDVDFVAADLRGVYWSVRTQRNGEPLAEELVISPVDGGPVRPVWSTMPAFSYVVQGWPDGAGGLVLVGAQRFRDENNYRTTVQSIDATGNARLLACGAAGSYPYIDDTPPAIAPDAFYFVALVENSQMQIHPRAARGAVAGIAPTRSARRRTTGYRSPRWWTSPMRTTRTKAATAPRRRCSRSR